MKSVMYLVSRALVVIVAMALMLYLAARSLNFLQYTMTGDEQLYSYLGLMATSGAAAVWLLLILFGQCSTGQLAIAYPFMLMGLLGEFGLAVADSYLGASLRDGIVKFTEQDLRLAILVAVGLASLQTLALIVFHLVEGNEFHIELPKLGKPARITPIPEQRVYPSPAPLGVNGNGNEKHVLNQDVPAIELTGGGLGRGEFAMDGKIYLGVDPDFEREMLEHGHYQPCLIIVKDENRCLDPFSADYRKVWEAIMQQPLPLAVGAKKYG